MTLPLQSLTPDQLALALSIPITEARKVHASVQREDFGTAHVKGVRRETLVRVRAETHIPTLKQLAARESSYDAFVKYALETHDAHVIETVRIPLKKPGRYSVCVSSQVGCALGCKFCATGRMGLKRNLEAWEIVEQVRTVRRHLPDGRVHGVVFQGDGVSGVENSDPRVRSRAHPTIG